MNPKELTDVWSRYSIGEEPDEREMVLLQHALAADPAVRAELAEDQQLDRMLSSMGAIHESQDEFVTNVVAACAGADNPFAPIVTTEPSHPPVRRSRRLALTVFGVTSALVVGMGLMAVFALQARDEARRAELQARTVAEEAERARDQLVQQAAAGNNKQPTNPFEPVDDPQPKPEPPVQAVPAAGQQQPAVAIVSRATDAVWRDGEAAKDGFPAGPVELLEGSAELTLNGGSRIELSAPVRMTLHNSTQLSLERGSLFAHVVPGDVGLRVATPNSRIVDLGTKFQVNVAADGRTTVRLDHGEVVVIPWQEHQSGRRWRLTSENFDEAIVFPADGERGPLASRVRGPAGFEGELQLRGAPVSFRSEEHFNRVHERVNGQFRTAPAEAVADWLALTRTFDSASGNVTVDGEDTPLDSLDSVMQFEDSLNNDDAGENDEADQNPGVRRIKTFAGTFIINGQQRSFRSREEYEQFRREILKPLERLGIRSPATRRLERDKKTNPFQ